MNRLIELCAMLLGGVSLFTVCFVGFVALSGTPMHEVAVIGKLFPERTAGAPEESAQEPAGADAPKNLSDAAVVEASLGVLSAWTLPSPYSTSELRSLAAELKQKRSELEQREHLLGRRERAVQEEERELEERLETLDALRERLEAFEQELSGREAQLTRAEDSAKAAESARWAEVARVIGELEPGSAGKRLLEYPPEEAARILLALSDEAAASEILNQLQGPRWKEYVDAYTSARSRAAARKPGKKSG